MVTATTRMSRYPTCVPLHRRRTSWPAFLRTALVIIAAALPMASQALEALPDTHDARVVPDHVLAQQRGGFFGPNGLEITFGLEQITALNGEILTQTTLQPLTPLGPAASSGYTSNRITIVNGSETLRPQALVTELPSRQGWVTTIQNELDGQAIHHQTIMQLEMRNLQMPRSDLGRALEQQLLDGGRGW